MPIAKRHFYNGKEYTIDENKQLVILQDDFHEKLVNSKLWGKFGFKKIGGSSFGDVLGTDAYKSQFRAFINICRLDMPILDMKYVNAGKKIEEKVLDLIRRQKKVESIDTFPAEKYNFDYFKDVPIFGGLPDGLEHPHDIVIEIKTTGIKNYDKWVKDGPPVSYLKQAMLYTHLMKKKKFAIVGTFLHEEDYIKPEEYNIENRKTRTFAFELKENEIIDDMETSRSWYLKHTKEGISPRYDLSTDGELLEYLKCKNAQEWEELINKWDKMGKINWESLGGK